MIGKKITALTLMLSLFLGCCMAEVPAGVPAESSELSLLAINVRKADALLLRSGESAYLIDTGTEDSFPALLKALQAEGITRLDGVILTHTHKDHAGGLEYLLPPMKFIFSPAVMAYSVGFAVLATAGAAAAACHTTLGAAAASLMRPRAPKPGKEYFWKGSRPSGRGCLSYRR